MCSKANKYPFQDQVLPRRLVRFTPRTRRCIIVMPLLSSPISSATSPTTSNMTNSVEVKLVEDAGECHIMNKCERGLTHPCSSTSPISPATATSPTTSNDKLTNPADVRLLKDTGECHITNEHERGLTNTLAQWHAPQAQGYIIYIMYLLLSMSI